MHNAEKDIIFEKLNTKLANYEAGEASDADWSGFAGAYQNQKRKGFWVKAGIALGLLVVTLVAIVWSTSQNKSNNKNTEPQSQPASAKAAVLEDAVNQEPTVVTTAIKTGNKTQRTTIALGNTAKEKAHPKVSGEGKETQLERKPNTTKERADIALAKGSNRAATTQPSEVESLSKAIVEANKPNVAAEQNTNEDRKEIALTESEAAVMPRTVHTPETIESHQPNIGQSLPKVNNLLLIAPTDSTKYLPKKPTQQKWFMDAGFMLVQNFNAPKAYPSDKYFKGATVNVGKYLGTNWFVTGGLQYAQMNETYLVYVKNREEQKEIISIDTSLKFVSAANRIMMQVDTLSHTRIVETEKEYQLTSQRTWYALPIMAGYEIGSPKRSLYMSAGMTTIMVNSFNTSLVKTETNERLVSKTQQNMIIAPTFGIGAYQRIYKNMGLYCSGQYLYYLPNAITTQQSFQIQTGLRIKF